ncbi:MAG: peptidoglycan DD-metalloendopeptidase family protein [Patescibacteria group bacterium]
MVISIKKIGYILLLFLFFVAPVRAVTVNELRSQQEEIKKQINDLNALVEQKKSDAVNLENQLAIFDAKISQLELQIMQTQLEIDELQVQIDDLTNEISLKQRMLEYQKGILDESLQILYERREQNLVMILLSANSFSDFVDQVTYIETVKDQVRQTIIEINKIKTSLEAQRGELNNDKSDLENLRGRQQEEQGALQNQKDSKQQLLDQTKGEEEEFQKQLEAAMAEEQQVEADIDQMIEEARRKLMEQYPDLDVTGEGFNYPLAGANRVGVIGGDYMDPYYGFGFPHTGVDLAAAQGTPVYAAAGGVVIVAHDSGGSGLSYIAIQHSNGYLTKYLHMSEIFVATGQYVVMGEAIGLSGGAPGTRGAGYFTTGPHLHFEINDANGYSVNPHNFLYIELPY